MLARIVNHSVKILKPPYSSHDIPALLGVLLLLLAIPFITLNLSNIGQNKTRAAAIPCPQLGPFGDVNGRDGITSDDVTMTNQIYLTQITPTPDQKKRADVDGDGQVTFNDVAGINNYLKGLSIQVTFRVCADNDNDGYTNVDEEYFGTDQYRACGASAWPPDTDNDKKITTLDVAPYVRMLNSYVTTPALQRLDFNRDGRLTQSGDIQGVWVRDFNKTCSISTTRPYLVFLADNKQNLSITAGDSETLTWVSVGTNTPCFQSDGWSGVVNTSDTRVITAQIGFLNKKYTITCGGANGALTQSVTVSSTSPCPNYLQNGQLYKKSDPEKAVFLIENCTKRPVTQDGMFKCHYNWSSINKATNGQAYANKYLDFIATGSQITENTSCPSAPVAYCSGDPYVQISPNPSNSGQSVGLTASQFKNCNKYDRVYFIIENSGINSSPSCTVNDGVSCKTTVTAPGAGSYRTIGCMNAAGTDRCSIWNPTGEREYQTMTVQSSSENRSPAGLDSGIDPMFSSPLDCVMKPSNYFGSGHWAKDLQCMDGSHPGRYVKSVSAGKVITAGFVGAWTVEKTPCGNEVRVRTTSSSGVKYIFRYCHMAYLSVNVGDEISQGTKLGAVGCTGYACTGPHLHLCVQEGSTSESCVSGSNLQDDGKIDPKKVVNGIP